MPRLDAPPLDVPAIVATLNRHGVRYVLIGGFAAILHGSPYPTTDADACPAADHENLQRLAAALGDMEAKAWSTDAPGGPPFACDAEGLAHSRIWNLVTTHGFFDLSLHPSGTGGYDDLSRSATEVELEAGLVVPVASLADIIRTKEAADRVKDRAVLPTLRALLERQDRDRG